MSKVIKEEVEIISGKIVEDLRFLVEEFNKKLEGWEKRSNCRANFRWVYKDERKHLVVEDVLLSVYSSGGPSEEVIEDVVRKMSAAESATVKPNSK